MNDSMDSVLTDDDGIELNKQLSKLWGKAEINIYSTHKWPSNSPVVLCKIPLKDRIQEVDLDKDILPSIKILGVVWMSEEDVFTFKSEQSIEFTKPQFLKMIATIFNQLGFYLHLQ